MKILWVCRLHIADFSSPKCPWLKSLHKGAEQSFLCPFQKRWFIIFNSFVSLFSPQGCGSCSGSLNRHKQIIKQLLLRLCFDSLSSLYLENISFWEGAVFGSAFSPQCLRLNLTAEMQTAIM